METHHSRLEVQYCIHIVSMLYCTVLRYLYCEWPIMCTMYHTLCTVYSISYLDASSSEWGEGFNSRLQTSREVVLCLHQHLIHVTSSSSSTPQTCDIVVVIIICQCDIICCNYDILTLHIHRHSSTNTLLLSVWHYHHQYVFRVQLFSV